MTKIQELNNSKVPIVAIDPSLNKYGDKTLFPEKLALAIKQLKGVKLPSKKSTRAKKSIAKGGGPRQKNNQL